MVAAKHPARTVPTGGRKGIEPGPSDGVLLDEYVKVPGQTSQLRQSPFGAVAAKWEFNGPVFTGRSAPRRAERIQSIRAHIAHAGGLDVLILGLESRTATSAEPGKRPDVRGRARPGISWWVSGEPEGFRRAITRRRTGPSAWTRSSPPVAFLILAHGPHKTEAVAAMPGSDPSPMSRIPACGTHSAVSVFLDSAVAGNAVPGMRPAPFTILRANDVGGTKIVSAASLLGIAGGTNPGTATDSRAPRRGGTVLEDVRWLVRIGPAESKPGVPHTIRPGHGICELRPPRGGKFSAGNAIQWETAGPSAAEAPGSGGPRSRRPVRRRGPSHAWGRGRFQSFLWRHDPGLAWTPAGLAGGGFTRCAADGNARQQPRHRAVGESDPPDPADPWRSLRAQPWSAICDAGGDPVLTAPGGGVGGGPRRRSHRPTNILTAAEALGSALGLLVNVLDPEAVIRRRTLTSAGLYSDTRRRASAVIFGLR